MDTKAERSAHLREVVEFLASPELEGRAAGTPGGAKARRFVHEQFESIGLVPAGEDAYLQAIPAIGGANLLGIIPGAGPKSERFVVLAAHYDHLGVWFGDTYPGANDNAAAVAVLVETAAQLAVRDSLGRSVLVCSFDAEEPPYFMTEHMGSVHFVSNPTVPLERIDLMVCLDIVGHSLGDESLPPEGQESIFVLGAERAPGVGELVDGVAVDGILPRRLHGGIAPPLSDHYAFEQASIPYLFFTSGRTRHYHTPQDTPEKLDYFKMASLSEYLTDLVVELSVIPVQYSPDGRDDAATLATLVALGTMVAPATSQPDLTVAVVDDLEEKLASGEALTNGDRALLSALLFEFEEALR